MTDELASRLHSLGYRLTPQRQLVLQAIETLGHATPDEIHRRAVAAWRSDVRDAAAGFLIPSIICLVIWSLVMWGEFFWPGFVMLGTGINLLQTAFRRNDLIATHERKLEKKRAKELGQPWTPNDKASE